MATTELDILLRAQRMGSSAYASESLDLLEIKKAAQDASLAQIEAAKAAQKAVEAEAAGSADAYELQAKAAQKATEAQIAQAEAVKAANASMVESATQESATLNLLKGAADAAAAAVKVALTIGAGIALGGALISADAVHQAADFQQQLVLIHTQAGAADENLGQINGSLLQMASQVGQGPTELAQGLYHVESAGFRGAQALDMVRNAAMLADVGQANLEDTTQAVIGTMAAFQAQNLSAAQAVAETNAIVGTGDMRMDQWDKAIATGILPTAATFGLTLKDVGAAVATLTDNVTPADEAATRLRMTFALMGAPSGPARKALGALGIDALQLADDMRKPNGLLVALSDLKDHLSTIDVSQVTGGIDTVKSDLQSFGLTDDEIQQALGKLGPTGAEQADLIARAFGGGKSSAAIMTLLTEFDRFQSKYQQIDDQSKSFTSDWQQQQDTFNQSWNDFKAGLDAATISLGQQFLPYASGFLVWLKDSLPSIQGTATALGKDLVGAGQQVSQWLKDARPLEDQFVGTFLPQMTVAIKDSQPALHDLQRDLSNLGTTINTTVRSQGFAEFIAALEVYVPAGVSVAVASLATAIDTVTIFTTAIGGLAHIAYDVSQGDWKAAWSDMQNTVQLQTGNMGRLSQDYQNEAVATAHATGSDLEHEYAATAAGIQNTIAGMYSNLDQQALEDQSNEEALANSIGGNIDKGLAAGITANAGLVHTAGVAAIRDALAGVQNDNIIQSPSGRWRDEVGLPLAQGVALGLWQGGSLITDAAIGITQPVASGYGTASPSGLPIVPAGAGAAASGSSPIINVYVTTDADPAEIGREVAWAWKYQ